MYLAKVFIQLKPTVNDPQGQTIRSGLRQLGFDNVDSVRAGKYMEIRLDEPAEEAASQKVKEMCEKLLANPIIENYCFELELLPTE
jgi:phosphoribosylformylglycinamidine synthase PurS subunit